MLLRDLLTRFSFEVDKKDVDKYDKTVGSMTKKALKLGAVFGGAFTVKSLFDAGRTTAQTAENLKAVADTEFNNLQKGLSGVKQSLEETRKGASEILTDRSFNILGTDFINTFGNGKKELKSFLVLLESASKLALRTGKPLEEVFSGFKNATVSGDLSIFDNVSGIDRTKSQYLENILSSIDPNELGGGAGRNQKLNAISKFINKAKPTQDKTLNNLSDSVFNATKLRLRREGVKQESSEAVYNESSKISEVFDKGLIKTIKVFKSLDKKTFFGETDKEGRTDAAKSWDSFPNNIKNIFSDYVDKHNKEYRNNKSLNSKQEINKTVNINVSATYKVEGSDSIAIDRAVEKGINKAVNTASQQIINTEDNRP